MKNEEVFRRAKEEETFYVKQNEGRLTERVISCVETAWRHFMKRIEGREIKTRKKTSAVTG